MEFSSPARSTVSASSARVASANTETCGTHGSSDSPIQQIGIYVDSGASDIIIDGCDVRKNGDYGIVVNAASDVVISGCDLSNNAVGGSDAGVQVNERRDRCNN